MNLNMAGRSAPVFKHVWVLFMYTLVKMTWMTKSHPWNGAEERLGYMTISTSCSTTHLNFVSRTKHVSCKQAPHCVTTINSACYQHQIQQQATSSASYFYNATVFTPVSWIVETKVQLTVTVQRLITRPPRVKCRNKAPKISFACQELK